MRNAIFTAIGLILTVGNGAHAVDPNQWYVQSAKAEMRAEPNSAGISVQSLKRGDAVIVLEQGPMWFKVKYKTKQGWIGKLFLSPYVPMGQTSLLKDTDETLEKSTRKRAPAYSVAASARGLMSEERRRFGQEKYRADYEALQQLESKETEEAKLEAFRNEAKLTGSAQ